MESRRKPRVFVPSEILFGDAALSSLAERSGCETIVGSERGTLVEALRDLELPIDLVVLPIGTGGKDGEDAEDAEDAIGFLVELRSGDDSMRIPVLGVASSKRHDLDLWQLRALGVVGLIDPEADAEHVRFRIGRVAWGRIGNDRRFERAPCRIAAEVEHGGGVVQGRVVSLSVGGLGVECGVPIEPNVALVVRFALGEAEQQIVARGRTVNLRRAHRSDDRYEVGVYFFEMSDEVRSEIGAAVERLLDRWDNTGGVRLASRNAPDGSRAK